jgi:hypothetical protein
MNTKSTQTEIRSPRRIRHSYTQTIHAGPDEIFPLYCPVRELDWAPGWRPDWVISESGVAEQGCVFQTPGDDSHHDESATWVITRHRPDTHEVEMFKVIPQHTLTKLQISLEPGSNGDTRATVAYEYTAFGPTGQSALDECSQEWYENLMLHWEKAMNHYLATGQLISQG